jgi:hypothetical protein
VESCGVAVGEITDCPAADGADDAIWRVKMGANNGTREPVTIRDDPATVREVNPKVSNGFEFLARNNF